MPLKRLTGVLIDLSGTLHVGDTPIKGAVEAIDRLRRAGIPFRFCTNTTKEGKGSLQERLSRVGISAKEEEIFTSLGACSSLLRSQHHRNPLYLLEGTALAEIQRDSQINADASLPHDVVVIGLSPSNFNYEKLNVAFRALRQGASLIAIHRATYMETADGLSLGPGPFVTALESATKVTAQVVGKPTAPFFQSAIDSLDGVNSNGQFAMIGDDVHQDLGDGAIKLGMERYLVQTGKYRPGDEDRGEHPSTLHVVPDVGVAIDRIISTWSAQSNS